MDDLVDELRPIVERLDDDTRRERWQQALDLGFDPLGDSVMAMTASPSPSRVAAPMRGGAPMRTLPSWFTVMGTPSGEVVTMMEPIAAWSSTRPSPHTKYASPFFSM